MSSGTMRAAVYHGPGDVRIEERPVPVPAAGEVLLRVLRSGICGTDLAEFEHGPRLFPLRTPHPVTGHVGPMTMGHEFTGQVVGVHDQNPASFAFGARVASGAGVSCGQCPW